MATENEQVTSEMIQVRTVGVPQSERVGKTVPDVAEVLVDQWGHHGHFTKGMVATQKDAEKVGYDWGHAVKHATVRLLTEAEVRALPLDDVDEEPAITAEPVAEPEPKKK